MRVVSGCGMIGPKGMCPCPLEGMSNLLLGKKWTISVIVTIGNFSNIRFNQLAKRLHNISPKTLTERLKELEQHGLVKKHIFAEVPARVEYSLTKRGEGLRDSVKPLMLWAARNNRR